MRRLLAHRPERLLHDGEELVLSRKPSLRVLAGPLLALAVALAAVVAAGATRAPDVAVVAAAVLLVMAAGRVLVRLAERTTTAVVLTTDRLLVRRGLLARSGWEVPVGRVTAVRYRQALAERLMRCGEVVVESGAEGGVRLVDVPRPAELQREILRLVVAEPEVRRRVERAGLRPARWPPTRRSRIGGPPPGGRAPRRPTRGRAGDGPSA